MSDFRADLHCHTTCSDGTLTPEEIIQLASDLKLQGLSITDHDTINAYQNALSAAQEKKVFLISGCEFSATHRQANIHILAYSFSLSSPIIQHFCQKHHQRRDIRTHAILKLLAAARMPLLYEDLTQESFSKQNRPIGRPHIALAMVKKGYVKSIQEAFQKYIGEGKSCYAPSDSFSIEETLDVIHQAKGLAVIAHPHLIEKAKVLNELLMMNFDGIEGYYAQFPKTVQERYVKMGAKKGWLITGGSDFHGEIKPDIPLGCSWAGEETFSLLQKHFQNNQ